MMDTANWCSVDLFWDKNVVTCFTSVKIENLKSTNTTTTLHHINGKNHCVVEIDFIFYFVNMGPPNTWNFLLASTPVVSITLLILHRQADVQCKKFAMFFRSLARVALYLALLASLINLYWSSVHKTETHTAEPAALTFVGIVTFCISYMLCEHTTSEIILTLCLVIAVISYAIRGKWQCQRAKKMKLQKSRNQF